MPFKKGQSGNPGGIGSDKEFKRALMLELKAGRGKALKLRRVARAVVDAAIEGDMRAANLIADRVDGKVPQAIGSPEGVDGIGPLIVEVVRFGEDPPAE